MIRQLPRFVSVVGILAAACLALPVLANVADGVRKWRAGDWNGAVASWQEPAARGDPDAMFNMGQAYRLGRGVQQNNQTAMDYFRRASDKGHVAATANLGITMFQDGRRTEAMGLLRQAADKGDQRATYVMGIATFNGDGAARNPVLGYAYMIRARETGMAQAGQQAARMATMLTPAERARAEAVAAALAAGEPVPVELLSPGGRPPPASLETAAAANTAPQEDEERAAETVGADADADVEASPAPVPVATPSTDQADWRVQIGAFASERAARSAWASLVSQSAELVDGQAPSYSPRGSMVRLQIGSFASQQAARDFCARLSAAGRPCFVTRS